MRFWQLLPGLANRNLLHTREQHTHASSNLSQVSSVQLTIGVIVPHLLVFCVDVAAAKGQPPPGMALPAEAHFKP